MMGKSRVWAVGKQGPREGAGRRGWEEGVGGRGEDEKIGERLSGIEGVRRVRAVGGTGKG